MQLARFRRHRVTAVIVADLIQAGREDPVIDRPLRRAS